MSKNNKVVSLQKYKKAKEKKKNRFLLIPLYLTIILAIYASFYLYVAPFANKDVKTVTETNLYLYK
ncbi:hypothetical protein LRS37_11845 [Neobacillus sedimentimangrovi]|jgi:flagellar basal body-associated protein FliL|uniref:Uncharacterized protein n=1 Tax=Neobacillus sedimentimangrovi TaxID=2699460 RepID=A0ABS8QKE5_9BACI|nr:hypothetical protein [Neobacillus sedimentimangrovi]AIM17795.1 hypothetical protein HW35_17325 [Bacillus sp. X1(2014)]MCD4839562.1 hypothetical protein [Neobacillus sedimentimangrovi]